MHRGSSLSELATLMTEPTELRRSSCRYLLMPSHPTCTVGAAVGGGLLGIVSVFWLAKSVELVVGNARCCLWAPEGDGRRGIVFAMIAGGFQLVTLAVAVAVIRKRAQRIALVAISLYGAITVLLLTESGSGEVQLLLNLIALVVAGLAIIAGLVVAQRRLRPET